MKKVSSFILAFIIAFLPIFNMNNLSFADSEPSLTAEYAILMDYESGKVLYSKMVILNFILLQLLRHGLLMLF